MSPVTRIVHGMRRSSNWWQLVRFGLIGALGFIVNLAVYTLLVQRLGIEYHVASAGAWLVAVASNFMLNRRWTFDARGERASQQAARFLVVSLVALALSQVLLTVLVEDVGLSKVLAQGLAVAGAMPLNFLGNKLWTFPRSRRLRS
jgi:putative flippase GtrA